MNPTPLLFYRDLFCCSMSTIEDWFTHFFELVGIAANFKCRRIETHRHRGHRELQPGFSVSSVLVVLFSDF